jgi:AI-2 transport protein TqsA
MTQMTETAEEKWSLPRGEIVVLGSAGVIITVLGMRQLQDILAPTVLALVIVIAVAPFGNWLKRKGAPGWVRTIAVMLAGFGILLGFVLIIAYAGVKLAGLIPQYSTDYSQLQDQVQGWLSDLGVTQDQINAATSSITLSDLSSYLVSLAGRLASSLSSLTFIAILLFFMAMDMVAFDERLGISKRIRPDIGAAFEHFVSGTRTYLIVATIFGAIVAVIDTGALAIMGIPLPFVWGLVAFVTNYIPNIGFIIGLVPPALLALVTGGVSKMIAVIVVYCVVNFIIQSVLQPKFVGDAVGLTTTMSFLSLIIWTFVLGPLGAILAIPVSLLVKAILVDSDPDAKWLQLFFGDEPVHTTRDPNRPKRHIFKRRHPAQSAADVGAAPAV